MNALRAVLLVSAILASNLAWGQEHLPQFRLGVQTHFEQGWSTKLIEQAARLGASSVRDEIDWSDTEQTKGVYDFSAADLYMLPLLDAGLSPFIVFTDTNPLYDERKTPHSKEGIAGLANYLSAIFAHYGADKIKIEIGNEVNSDNFSSGPFTQNKPASLAATVRAVHEKLAKDHPGATIVCTGLNTISIQFYREFFQAGGLQACDGISFHPYRDNPDTLGVELDRLKSLMREFGGEKPLYATEFGIWLDDPQDAPDFMSKMVVQLAAAGVHEAHWYALIDEPWWPNMGLLEEDGKTEKPAAGAFRFLQERLLPLGRPVSRSPTSAMRIFEFGDNGQAFAVWGGGGILKVDGEARYFDTGGRPIDPVNELTDSPVYILGKGLNLSVDASGPVADTKYQFNQPPWSYFALRAGKTLTPLDVIDWNWTSYRGAPDLAPLKIGDNGITTALFQGKPYHAIERFTAEETGTYLVRGWWRASPDTEPSRLIISRNRKAVLDIPELTPERFELEGLKLELREGDVVDFELAPTGPEGNGSVRRRIQVVRPPIAD